MKIVTVHEFGGVDQLQVTTQPNPTPQAGELVIRLTSIGMNYAEIMGRRGHYKISTGEPPFTPGLEGGGIVESVGPNIDNNLVGQRVILTPDAPRPEPGSAGGTYRTHYLCTPQQIIPAPDAIPDDQLGAIWLPYLTAWGCLVWLHDLQPNQVVAFPAASSSVALAATQIAKSRGCTTIGLTTSPDKSDELASHYDHLIITHTQDDAGNRTMKPWHRDIKSLTNGRGVDVFFDPVAAGEYLNTEIRCLAQRGCIYVYGLLGRPDTVDVTPLIRKQATIRGWGLTELVQAGDDHWRPACEAVLAKFEDGTFKQTLSGTFPLDDVQQAHTEMEKGKHIGKLVLLPA